MVLLCVVVHCQCVVGCVQGDQLVDRDIWGGVWFYCWGEYCCCFPKCFPASLWYSVVLLLPFS